MINLSPKMPAHIVVVDQNRLFRERLTFLLQKSKALGAVTIHHYDRLHELTQSSQANIQSPIDLLLTESAQSPMHSEDTVLGKLKAQFPHMRIIGLSENHTDPSACSFLQKPFTETLQHNHHFTLTINKQIESEALIALISRMMNQETYQKIESLTPREIEILQQLAKGDSNKEIARLLTISESTVKVHVQNILKKLDVTSRVEAAVFAIKNAI